jgi:hypothetical protein
LKPVWAAAPAWPKLPPLMVAVVPGALDPVGETKLMAPPSTVAPSRLAM